MEIKIFENKNSNHTIIIVQIVLFRKEAYSRRRKLSISNPQKRDKKTKFTSNQKAKVVKLPQIIITTSKLNQRRETTRRKRSQSV